MVMFKDVLNKLKSKKKDKENIAKVKTSLKEKIQELVVPIKTMKLSDFYALNKPTYVF